MSAPPTEGQVTLSLPVLRKGQHPGEHVVEQLQYLLDTAYRLPADRHDGIFGPRTEEKVRWFQHKEGLTIDGIVGAQTWTALLRRWLLIRPEL